MLHVRIVMLFVILAEFSPRGTTTEKIKKIKKTAKQLPKLPKSVTINQCITATTGKTYIPYFRGIFMRTILPIGGVYQNESGIINLNNADGPHWMA